MSRLPDITAEAPARTIEVPAFAGFVIRSIRALGRRAGDHDPESLRVFVTLRQELDDAETAAMLALLDAGFSYRDMARSLGVTHVAVLRRLQRRRAS
jgi:DNA-directed RNA polymerase specialized sigma24 family protein